MFFFPTQVLTPGFRSVSALAIVNRRAPAACVGALVACALPSGSTLIADTDAKGFLYDGRQNPPNGLQHAVVTITEDVIKKRAVIVLRTTPTLIIATCKELPDFKMYNRNIQYQDTSAYTRVAAAALAYEELKTS